MSLRFLAFCCALVFAALPARADDFVGKRPQALLWRGDVIDLNPTAAFYEKAGASTVWTTAGRPNGRARELVQAINNAESDGLSPNDYLSANLRDPGNLASTADTEGFERAMSAAFLRYARDIHGGRASPSIGASNIVITRKPVEPEVWLPFVRDKGVEAALKKLRPSDPQYYQLRQMLAGYRALAARGGWNRIPAGPSLKPGMNDARVKAMRDNLKARGYSGIDGGTAYDPGLVAVVKHFQKRHGLEPDGIAGKGTIDAMNVSAQARVQQIIVNMERWRWLPADLGQRFVFVNQAGFELFLNVGGKTIDRRRVIVGKPFHETPMFSNQIAYAEFNPTWTVTPAIAVNEFLPKLRKDPGYLARNNYVLYGGWGAGAPVIDPYSVNWAAVTGKSFPYKIVQQAGPNNALGVVKFMFPNPFNVYLHDTPSRQLFAETGRAFSHGCIRVEKPVEFANKLFGLDGSLTPAQIKALIDAGKTKAVNLKSKVPVHLTYFTTWVDDDGAPYFFPDIYGRDTMVSRILFGGA